MPRRPRIHLDNVPPHIVQRGHNREPCFFGQGIKGAMLIHYRWASYRHNALGQANPYLTPHRLYMALGRDADERQAAYRELFRTELNQAAVDDIRLALNQNQPLGNSRFYAKIEAMTGQRREARPRGRPRVRPDGSTSPDAGQAEPPV